jgi:hypothetical protein
VQGQVDVAHQPEFAQRFLRGGQGFVCFFRGHKTDQPSRLGRLTLGTPNLIHFFVLFLNKTSNSNCLFKEHFEQ